MRRGQRVHSKRRERSIMNNRAKVALGVIIACMGGLTAHVYDIQINQHEKQAAVAKSNSIKDLMISPTRGEIVDRNGTVIAGNRPMYDLIVVPDRITGFRKDRDMAAENYLEVIQKFIPLSESEHQSAKNRIKRSSPYQKVIVKRDLNENQLAIVIENSGLIEGTGFQAKKVRHYPYGGAFLSPLGYVGKISPEDVSRFKDENRKVIQSDFTGKMGLEKEFDQSLYGEVGNEIVALNARGKIVERAIDKRSVQGETLRTTLDAKLQLEAYKLMDGRKGAVIISDINTGDLLTVLSVPTVDPNLFLSVNGMPNSLLSKGDPLFNRAAKGQYPPASTIKPLMALAALEGDFINADSVRWSGPFFELGGHRFRDWKRQGHGHVDMIDAVAVSSDVYFYRLANLMGINYIHDFFAEFGFGKPTGVAIQGEEDGLLPSSEWKRRVKKEPWHGGETLNVGIGQGFFMATPMQLNVSTSMMLNGGKLFKPNMIQGQEPQIINEVNLNPEHIESIKKSMESVVYGKRGTAQSLRRIAEVPMAGKTGTSQVFSTKGVIDYENEEMPEHLRDHAVFIGYAPMDNPQIAITVFVEHGSSGSRVAAPIAQKLANKWAEGQK